MQSALRLLSRGIRTPGPGAGSDGSGRWGPGGVAATPRTGRRASGFRASPGSCCGAGWSGGFGGDRDAGPGTGRGVGPIVTRGAGANLGRGPRVAEPAGAGVRAGLSRLLLFLKGTGGLLGGSSRGRPADLIREGAGGTRERGPEGPGAPGFAGDLLERAGPGGSGAPAS